MIWTLFVGFGALFGAVSVGAGAFAAHLLRNRLDDYSISLVETAARYQMYHALALIGVGLVSLRLDDWMTRTSGFSFILGILVFSGSLYVLAFTGMKWLGAITPIGGVMMIIGWLMLSTACFFPR